MIQGYPKFQLITVHNAFISQTGQSGLLNLSLGLSLELALETPSNSKLEAWNVRRSNPNIIVDVEHIVIVIFLSV